MSTVSNADTDFDTWRNENFPSYTPTSTARGDTRSGVYSAGIPGSSGGGSGGGGGGGHHVDSWGSVKSGNGQDRYCLFACLLVCLFACSVFGVVYFVRWVQY